MCDQTTTNICNQLAAQANELRIAEQHEAAIAAAQTGIWRKSVACLRGIHRTVTRSNR